MRSVAPQSSAALSIGELSGRTGVNIETIRYYERVKVLPAPPRTASGRRVYGPAETRTLAFIRRARELGVSDPEIMGGDPVFRGTRVPVHLIATLLGQGSAAADLLEAYPRLTAEMVQLAPIYATAYPLRGRPRAQPWHDQAPVQSARRKLETIEAG